MASFEETLDAIERKLDREINLFNREFEKILDEVAKEVQAKSIELKSNPLEFDFAFQKILRDTGYYALVNRFIDDSYDKSYQEILDLFKLGGLSATFDQNDLDSILSVKNLDIEFFKQIGNQAANRLKGDMLKYTLSDLSSRELAENIRNSLLDTELAKYSKTYAETAISNFNQSVIDLKAQNVTGEVYIYRGVNDSKTRDFCKCLLKQRKYYDKSNATIIKNDKRRQYNCRHLIVPVSRQYAMLRGFKEGKATC